MSQCTDEILARLGDSTLFSTWKGVQQAELNRLSQLTGPTAEANKNTGITTIETAIAKHLACAREKLQAAENTPADIVSLQAQYAQAEKDARDAEKDVAVSKERTQMLRNPERKVTVYESWFPIHRPLRTSSALLLIGITLFLICLSLAFLLHQMGLFVDLGILTRVSGPASPLSGLFQQITPLTIGIGVVAVGLLGGLIYFLSK